VLLVASSEGHRWSEVRDFGHCLSFLLLDFLHDLRHAVLNMNEKDLRQLFCQFEATESLWRHRGIDRVRCKIGLLFSESLVHGDLVDNVLLSSVFDTDVAETEFDLLIHDHFLGVSTTVHDVDLRDYTDGTDTLLIKCLSHLQTI